ncbi:hypothetical protein GCM10020331_064870 [Ectobacillus funiculus]
MYITQIHHTFDGDTYFPSFNKAEWTTVSEKEGQVDERNIYQHTFLCTSEKFIELTAKDDSLAVFLYLSIKRLLNSAYIKTSKGEYIPLPVSYFIKLSNTHIY